MTSRERSTGQTVKDRLATLRRMRDFRAERIKKEPGNGFLLAELSALTWAIDRIETAEKLSPENDPNDTRQS